MLWPLLVLSLPLIVNCNVLCYVCYANSTTIGQYCAIDNLCYGEACIFSHVSSGQWEAGCTTAAAAQGTGATPQCSLDGTNSNCYCTGDLCNSIKNAQAALTALWGNEPPFNTYSLDLPSDNNLQCQECGNVTFGGSNYNIPCGTQNICKGNYCIMVRGTSPHAYCGTTWDPVSDIQVQCEQNAANQAQTCYCKEHMCNVIMAPQNWPNTTLAPTTAAQTTPTPQTTTTTLQTTTIPQTTTTTLQTTTTTTLQTTTATLQTTTTTKGHNPPPSGGNNSTGNGTICPNGQQFTPNEQAVYMGEKMKDIIVNGFGQNEAVDEFTIDADNHICNYSPHSETDQGKK